MTNVITLITVTTVTQKTLTCSKPTMERLEKVWTMFKVNNKDNRTSPISIGSENVKKLKVEM